MQNFITGCWKPEKRKQESTRYLMEVKKHTWIGFGIARAASSIVAWSSWFTLEICIWAEFIDSILWNAKINGWCYHSAWELITHMPGIASFHLHSQLEVRAAPTSPHLALPRPQTLSRPLFRTDFSFLLTPGLPLQLFLRLYVACESTWGLLPIPEVIYIGITTVNSLWNKNQ